MIFGWGQRKQREILNQTPATLDDGEKKNGSLMTGIEKSFCETFLFLLSTILYLSNSLEGDHSAK